MTREELRALARQIVSDKVRERLDAPATTSPPVATYSGHSSHGVYVTLVNTGDACVIEPDVPCTHCNYCKSHGH